MTLDSPSDGHDYTSERAAPWHVLGAGALGTVIAHRLAEAGIRCTLLSHRGAGRRELRIGASCHSVAVGAVDEVDAASIERLLLTTKAGQIEAAMQLALPHLAPDGVVLTTANGLGFPERFAHGPQTLRLHRAVSTAAAYRDEAGTVTLAAIGTTRVGGDIAPAPWFSDSLARLADWHWDADIAAAINEKFALNCVINPLTATRRCRNGELVSDARAAADLAALCSETQPALTALGMWSGDEALLTRARQVCRDTARNRSSMLQDVLAGRETEIAYLTGELVRRARCRGMELPRSADLCDTIQALHP